MAGRVLGDAHGIGLKEASGMTEQYLNMHPRPRAQLRVMARGIGGS